MYVDIADVANLDIADSEVSYLLQGSRDNVADLDIADSEVAYLLQGNIADSEVPYSSRDGITDSGILYSLTLSVFTVLIDIR